MCLYTAGKLLWIIVLLFHWYVYFRVENLSANSNGGDSSWFLPHKKNNLNTTLTYLPTEPRHPSHNVQPPSPSPCSATTPFAYVNLPLPMSPLCRNRQRMASPQQGRQSSTTTPQQGLPPPVRSGGRDHCEPGTTTGQSLCTLDRWAEMR